MHDKNCWCEPAKFYWVEEADGQKTLVIEHNDEQATYPTWVMALLNGVGKD